MAEVRCPMCGKPNPVENEVCQYCQARIKPLVIPPPEEDATRELSPPSISPDTPRIIEPPDEEPIAPGWLQPDWLQSLRDEDRSAELSESEVEDWEGGEESEIGGSSEEEGAPEWLLHARERRTAEVSEEAIPEEGFDFMAQLPSEPSQEKIETFTETPLEEETELPSWLAGLGAESDQEAPPPLPEWLKSEGVIDISEETTRPIPPSVESLPGEEEDVPDWLKVLQEKAAIDEGVSPTIPQAEQEIQGAVIEEEPPTAEEIKVVAPFTFDEETAELLGADLGELPDWLKEAPLTQVEEKGEEPPEYEDLAPGSLPAWMEMMRPVEAAAPTAPQLNERERLVEGSGPLAGLRGVLPAEPEVASVRKPPPYAVKLQVAEGQKLHAALLSELLKAEGVAQTAASQGRVSSQSLLRILIFVVLLTSIAWQLVSGGMVSPTPEPPAEIIEMRTVINSLNGGEPVLVAVDYEPGLSGEMDAAAAAVIDHLMLKGAYLTLVSTLPTGPAQGERLLRMVNERGGHHYQARDQYTNLGYIPGGISGLRGFAEAPQRMTPYALDGSLAWSSEKLSGVHRLSDFSLALVITESPEQARAWIEQIRPGLGDRPLLMVVSAQAEAVVRPYYEGVPRQVQGLVIGLPGGVAYEVVPRNSPARQYWDAYSFGLTTAIMLMALGSVVGLITSLLPSARKPLAKGVKS